MSLVGIFRCLATTPECFLRPILLRSNLPARQKVDVILASSLRALLCRTPLPSLALAPPHARLSLISRHLENRPLLEINTPFSTERQSTGQDDIDYTPLKRDLPKPEQKERKMSNQAEHPTVLIPGPIEFADAVLESMSHSRSATRHALPIALS